MYIDDLNYKEQSLHIVEDQINPDINIPKSI